MKYTDEQLKKAIQKMQDEIVLPSSKSKTQSTPIDAIKAYKEAYTKAAAEIDSIINNADYTAEAKERHVQAIVKKHSEELAKRQENCLNELKDLQSDIRSRRKDNISKGLKAADEISLITDAIKNNSFDTSTLADIVDIYNDNPIALAAVRGALNNSNDESVRIMAASIPTDNTEKMAAGIDRAIDNISNMPAISTPADDITAMFWRNGNSFDNLANYIEAFNEQ